MKLWVSTDPWEFAVIPMTTPFDEAPLAEDAVELPDELYHRYLSLKNELRSVEKELVSAYETALAYRDR